MQADMIHPREPSQNFAQSGVAVRLLRGPAPTRFQVLGERSSGTNLVKRLIMMNSDLEETELLGWKHGFPSMEAIPSDLLVVGVVREATSWARSMHAKPWHTTPAMQKKEFSAFIRAPWDTIVDHQKYFINAEKAGTIGHYLQYDRHPITGKRFTSLFDLRRVKLQGLVGYLSRNCHVALLRAETVQDEPQKVLSTLLESLGRTSPEKFKKVGKRLGTKFNPLVTDRPATPLALNDDDLAFMKSRLDMTLEARLGYTYKNSH